MLPKSLATFARLCLLLSMASFFTTSASAQFRKRSPDKIDPRVDKIYKAGLKHLATTQLPDGSWPGTYRENPGLVGLCLLAFLANGEDPNHSLYAKNIKRGLEFIVKTQTDNGQFISPSKQCGYTHGFALLALAEAYGMVNDTKLGKALVKGVEFTVSNQNKAGGWRYRPKDTSTDLSVVGCKIVALYAARNAGIKVPQDCLDKAFKYVDRCRKSDNGYSYTERGSSSTSMASVGLLCHYLAKDTEEAHIKGTVSYLKKNLNNRSTKVPYYLEYYMAQALFQSDLELWREWNKKQITYLSSLQQSNGSFNSNMGTAFATSCSLLSIALNFRFLPIYER